DREAVTRRELMAQLMVLLAGRVAEKCVFGEPSTRAEDDLEQAAILARRMVERWAMTGRLDLTRRGQDHPLGSGASSPADEEIRALLARAEQGALTILRDNGERLRAVAEALMKRETLTLTEITDIAGLSRINLEEEKLAPVTPLPARRP
ncbi:MAG: hypothetical protein ACRD0D_00415, partial [Acidimicrobiales bacterium]